MVITMLVLSRKKSQKIKIGEFIEVTVVSMKGGKVRIAIDAPINVKIMRSELESDPDTMALCSDWVAVGQDFRFVIERQLRKLVEHGKESITEKNSRVAELATSE